MMQWIRNNLVLVAGIVLPVLLVIGFVLLQATPRLVGDPPAHDFLAAGASYDPHRPVPYRLSFEVRDGQLHLRATPADTQVGPVIQQMRLFRYSAADHAFTELAFELPGDLDRLEQPVSRLLDETRHLQLDTSLRSPDGFQFEFTGYRSRGGLLGELFGMGYRHDSQYVLSRDGAMFPLPNPDRQRYYGQDLSFIGWVVGEGD